MLNSWSTIKKILLKLLTVWVKILKENFESLIEFEELKPYQFSFFCFDTDLSFTQVLRLTTII